jgi:DNA-binding NarL/FixJ family response regulator
MPKMNGIDAARILKRMMPEVPLILFSEYGDLVSDAEARSAGISAVVPKSAHVSVLLATVRRHCGPIAA